jgi:uncharacterized protein (TIGR00661 family)
MRILYAVQATGNGHIARAIELVPHLQKYGKVDVFLSGNNASLRPDLPIKFRSAGISLFYGNTGKLDLPKIVKQVNPFRIREEIKKLPVREYDLVISDFEFISAHACNKAGIPFWHYGHQASFYSKNTPRPLKKDRLSEWILQNYCNSKQNVGFHFKPYEDWILPPIIKQALWEAKPQAGKHLTVYLPHYSMKELRRYLYGMGSIHFQVFSKEVQKDVSDFNIQWRPINNQHFTQSMIQSAGVICGAGFETPAEALFLGKPLMVIPIQGQYEQYCNAVALQEFGVTVIPKLDIHFGMVLKKWAKEAARNKAPIHFLTTEESVKRFMQKAVQ